MICDSGSKSLNQPTSVLLQTIAQAIMKPILAALPKLYQGRAKAITAPVRRPRYLVAKLRGCLRVALLQDVAVLNYFALIGGPGAQPAAERAAEKVFV